MEKTYYKGIKFRGTHYIICKEDTPKRFVKKIGTTMQEWHVPEIALTIASVYLRSSLRKL